MARIPCGERASAADESEEGDVSMAHDPGGNSATAHNNEEGNVRDTDPMHTEVEGTPFSVLMQQAAKLKAFRSAPLRSKFDSFPSFYQNTLFPPDEVALARSSETFAGRLAAASIMKEEGGEAFRNGRFREATMKYEMAVSTFKYIENTNPAWNTQGIQDRFMKEVAYECKGTDEEEKLREFLISCYLNMALANLKLAAYSVAIAACQEVLLLDICNPKALYLRSQARCIPTSASPTEQEMALADLAAAVKYSPNNRFLRTKLRELREELRKGREGEKAKFLGLFERGELHYQRSCSAELNRSKLYASRVDTLMRRAESMADYYASIGKRKKEKDLRQYIKQIWSEQPLTDVNLRDPSPAMVQKYTSMGIDLSNNDVVNILEAMNRARCDEHGNFFEQLDKDIFGKEYSAITEVVQKMGENDLRKALHEMKVPLPASCSDDKMRLLLLEGFVRTGKMPHSIKIPQPRLLSAGYLQMLCLFLIIPVVVALTKVFDFTLPSAKTQ